MTSQEDNVTILMDFLEKSDIKLLIIYTNSQGQLAPTNSYPGATKAKVRTCLLNQARIS